MFAVSLELTPLRIANVPPPMSLHQVGLEQKATDVAVSKSNTRLAVLSNKDLTVYALEMKKKPVPLPKLLWRSKALTGHYPRHVAFVGDDNVFVITDSWDEELCSLWTSKEQELVLLGQIDGSRQVSSLVTSLQYEKLYLQYRDGAISSIEAPESPTDVAISTTVVNKFPSFAPEARVFIQNDCVCIT